MSTSARAVRVLRVAFVRDGRIEEERITRAGQDVAIEGEPLFVFDAGSYLLRFGSETRGKLQNDGRVRELRALVSSGRAARVGDHYELRLAPDARGKLALNGRTVLFQLIDPPAVGQQLVPLSEMRFRPRWIEDDDPRLFGWMSVFTAAAAALLIWVQVAPDRPPVTIDVLPERAKAFVIAAEPPEEVEPIEVDEPEPVVEHEPERVEKVEAPDPVPSDPVQQAQRTEDIKRSLLEESAILERLGTTGEGRGTTDMPWGTSDDTRMASVLAKIRRGAEVKADSGGTRQGEGTSNEDARIDVGPAGDGAVGGIDGPDVVVTADDCIDCDIVKDEPVAAAGLREAVQKQLPQLQYCYEMRLKEVPSLSGRLELEWAVSSGRVTAARVSGNTTGDAPFADCAVRKVRMWRFPAGIEGEITWPFVFKPRG